MRRQLADMTCGILLASPAQVGEDEAPDFANVALTGDWAGARQAAWQSGLSIEAAFKLDVMGNRRGQGRQSKEPVCSL